MTEPMPNHRGGAANAAVLLSAEAISAPSWPATWFRAPGGRRAPHVFKLEAAAQFFIVLQILLHQSARFRASLASGMKGQRWLISKRIAPAAIPPFEVGWSRGASAVAGKVVDILPHTSF